MSIKISCSLVLYENSNLIFEPSILSFLNSCDGKIYVVDNSPIPLTSDLFFLPRVIYYHSHVNLGFGSAHNYAFNKMQDNSEFHLILNPDIYFDVDVLSKIIKFMSVNHSVGAVMPRVCYPDGDEQFLAKLLPTPVNLIERRFFRFEVIKSFFNRKYELQFYDRNSTYISPSLSACFLLCRSSIFSSIGGFDPRYFMYMEDVDLVRRIGNVSKTIFFPVVTVTHHYGKGSYLKLNLLKYHIVSALKYFNKWGWLFDRDRKVRNSFEIINFD